MYSIIVDRGEAAKAVGFSKPTLSRAIKNGKLSAKRLDDGSYSIDAAELERWKDANGHRNGAVKRIATLDEAHETPMKPVRCRPKLRSFAPRSSLTSANVAFWSNASRI